MSRCNLVSDLSTSSAHSFTDFKEAKFNCSTRTSLPGTSVRKLPAAVSASCRFLQAIMTLAPAKQHFCQLKNYNIAERGLTSFEELLGRFISNAGVGAGDECRFSL
jgi:hypothetical protein